MKSTLKKLTEKEKYPCLKIIKGKIESEQYVVLFASLHSGMVVYAGEFSTFGVGYYSSQWATHMFEDVPQGTQINIEV